MNTGIKEFLDDGSLCEGTTSLLNRFLQVCNAAVNLTVINLLTIESFYELSTNFWIINRETTRLS